MPSDGVKQRKGKAAAAHHVETTDISKPCGKDEVKEAGDAPGKTGPYSSVDVSTVVSLLSLSACFLLAW